MRYASRLGRRLAAATVAAALLAGVPGAARAAYLQGQIRVDPNNGAWLVYNKDDNGDGKKDPFFMCGPGGPEGFLYGDITPGWTQTGIINYLETNGGNCIYLTAVRSHNGDGGSTQNPWIDNDPSKGLDQNVLNQWETWFTQMDDAGIVVFFIFYDDQVGHVGGDQFITDIVNEFEHHKHLIWCVAEESHEAMPGTTVQHIAAVIRSADDYDHPAANHDRYYSGFDQHAYQTTSSGPSGAHSKAKSLFSTANGRYNLNSAEDHAADAATVSNDNYRKIIWATAMGGAYFMQLGCWETVKSRKPPTVQMCNYNRVLYRFFESTNFNQMSPRDDLAHGGSQWVLADPGQSYVAYSDNAAGLGVKSMTAGTYDLTWVDPVDGDTVTQTGVNVGSGDRTFSKPAGIGSEVAVWIRKTGAGDTTPPAPPAGLTATTFSNTQIDLDWADNGEGDLAGYNVYCGTTSGFTPGDGNRIASGLTSSAYSDKGLPGSTKYYYVVTAVDTSGNESDPSNEASATTLSDNDAPAAGGDGYSVDEDNTLSVSAPGVLGNDTDPNNDPLSAVLVADVSHGALSLNGNGSFTYTPEADFDDTDSFTYKASDGTLQSSPATVTITVNPINDAPTAKDKAVTTVEDTSVDIQLVYTDPDGPGIFTVTIVAPAAHGTILGTGNDRTYAPDSGYSGGDFFTWKVNDGLDDGNVATVNIEVYADADGDGLPDWWEEKYGLDPDSEDSDGDGVLDPDDDMDFDGVSNMQEYLDNTDPGRPGGVTGGPGGISCAPGGAGAASAITALFFAAAACARCLPRKERPRC